VVTSPQGDPIATLYSAFAALDVPAMAACYAEDATFNDPAFSLRGRREIAGMWGMLCDAVRRNGRDVWCLELVRHHIDGDHASAEWHATYRFSATQRLVNNRINASFVLRDGLIARHQDGFDFYRWSRQALGPVGWLLGATPWLRGKVRAQAASNLARFLAKDNNK
jgi:ketosteroid isomerase-like protein